MPLDLPSANGLPPLASATTSPVARIVAVSSAPTASGPPAVAVMPVIERVRAAADVVAGGGARRRRSPLEALTFGR